MATETTGLQQSNRAQTPLTHTPVSIWERVILGVVLLVSAFFNIFQLDQQGYGNLYYAATVKSMLENWSNFFFVSFDPGGFVTVDKPPLGLWIQAASAKIFGFSGLSILLPQALAGVLSVALLYYLVRRIFGPIAGLIAALTLALSPINVVTNRNNTADSLLVLIVLLAAWCVSLAVEKGRLRWLLLTALIVGLGFNIKMLQAYLVVPAFGLVYLLGAPLRWRTRIAHLLLATLVLLIVSFSWVAAVDLTPASQRPYIGSSQNNSEINLAFGYNGLERLTGYNTRNSEPSASSTHTNIAAASENGEIGPLRLFNIELGGQISWLLPLAVLGLLAAGWQTRVRLPLQRRQQALVLWGTWLLTMYVFFSVANFYHRYYLSMLAPAICALVGIGIVSLWNDYQRTDWRRWLLPCALLVTAFVQVELLSAYAYWSRWLTPTIVSLSLIAAAALVIGQLLPHLRPNPGLATAVGLLALLFAPIVGSALPIWQGVNPTLPSAGPPPGRNSPFARIVASPGATMFSDAKLIQYLEANQGHTRYLVATLNVPSAAPIILDTGKPVMALGGFTGTDPILTAQQLQSLVSNGTVRFFLLPPPISLDNLPPQIRELIEKQIMENQGGPNSDLTQWVSSHCNAVPSNLWLSGSYGSLAPFPENRPRQQLYDCAT